MLTRCTDSLPPTGGLWNNFFVCLFVLMKIKTCSRTKLSGQTSFSFSWFLVLLSWKMSSARDTAILNSILNPFLPVGTDFDTEEPVALKDDIGEYTKQVAEAKRIERFAVDLAENGKVEDAIRNFSEAITIAPHLASLFNNRGQAYRLAGDTKKALLDLDRAVLLSEGKGKSACQALCQRGLIHRKNGDDVNARRDFKRAAELGSGFAKMALIQMNPYAALCNQMLSQIIEKLQNGSND